MTIPSVRPWLVGDGIALCALAFATSSPAASKGLVKDCSGKTMASDSGIRFVGTHVQVTALAYNAYKVYNYHHS